MSCPNCGSWAVRADRSLAGRMICGRCGQPLGGQLLQLRRHRGRWGGLQPRRWIGWLALVTLVGISALLAAGEPPPRSPWPRPPERLPQGGGLF